MLTAAMPRPASKTEWARRANAPHEELAHLRVLETALVQAKAQGFDTQPFLDARVEKNKTVPNTATDTRKQRADAYVAEARKLCRVLAGSKAKKVREDLRAAAANNDDICADLAAGREEVTGASQRLKRLRVHVNQELDEAEADLARCSDALWDATDCAGNNKVLLERLPGEVEDAHLAMHALGQASVPAASGQVQADAPPTPDKLAVALHSVAELPGEMRRAAKRGDPELQVVDAGMAEALEVATTADAAQPQPKRHRCPASVLEAAHAASVQPALQPASQPPGLTDRNHVSWLRLLRDRRRMRTICLILEARCWLRWLRRLRLRWSAQSLPCLVYHSTLPSPRTANLPGTGQRPFRTRLIGHSVVGML